MVFSLNNPSLYLGRNVSYVPGAYQNYANAAGYSPLYNSGSMSYSNSLFANLYVGGSNSSTSGTSGSQSSVADASINNPTAYTNLTGNSPVVYPTYYSQNLSPLLRTFNLPSNPIYNSQTSSQYSAPVTNTSSSSTGNTTTGNTGISNPIGYLNSAYSGAIGDASINNPTAYTNLTGNSPVVYPTYYSQNLSPLLRTFNLPSNPIYNGQTSSQYSTPATNAYSSYPATQTYNTASTPISAPTSQIQSLLNAFIRPTASNLQTDQVNSLLNAFLR